MPYNVLGDLYKSEIVKILQDKGFPVKNVHDLNLILEKMGVLLHIGNSWLTTDEGVKHTIYKSKVYDADGWHPSIVDAVIEYLQNKK